MAEVAEKTDVKAGTKAAFGNERVVVKKDAHAEPAPTPVPDPPPAAPTPDPVQTTAKIDLDTLSDEEFNAALAKRTKGAVNDYKSYIPPAKKTKEELEADEKAQKAAAIEWAFSSGATTREAYDQAVILNSKTDRDIALQLFAEEVLQEDSKATPDEIEVLFKQHYMEDAAENDPARKIRMREMAKSVSAYKKDKAGILETLDSDYQNFVSLESRRTSFGKQVDTLFDKVLPKEQKVTFKYAGTDGKEFDAEIPYTIDDADIRALKKIVKSDITFRQTGADKNDVSDEDLLTGVNYHLKAMIFDKMVSSIAVNAAQRGAKDWEAYHRGFKVKSTTFGDTQMTPEQATQTVNKAEQERARKEAVTDRFKR